jgi:hypothetical protein
MATAAEVRTFGTTLPRGYEAIVRNRVKLRVGRIVFVDLAIDDTVMGFAFPKDEREALVLGEPAKFMLPRQAEMRYNWLHCRLDTIDRAEMEELIIDAWAMCVPRKVANQYLAEYRK